MQLDLAQLHQSLCTVHSVKAVAPAEYYKIQRIFQSGKWREDQQSHQLVRHSSLANSCGNPLLVCISFNFFEKKPESEKLERCEKILSVNLLWVWGTKKGSFLLITNLRFMSREQTSFRI